MLNVPMNFYSVREFDVQTLGNFISHRENFGGSE